ncbi:MAG: hypothetical protein ISR82_02160 [Candidatus Marinimicrobia bacterium]|nr:hypothetical protein [Candidatus Neomarinimicrobiota bacterium]MBL7010011.1 hypothetical protein [Candidatus Neomarinimicrobiota bacterium]MBL7029721.1 hypothetical protein [Candidatus Neomarinimicrobiota bacterium]
MNNQLSQSTRRILILVSAILSALWFYIFGFGVYSDYYFVVLAPFLCYVIWTLIFKSNRFGKLGILIPVKMDERETQLLSQSKSDSYNIMRFTFFALVMIVHNNIRNGITAEEIWVIWIGGLSFIEVLPVFKIIWETK